MRNPPSTKAAARVGAVGAVETLKDPTRSLPYFQTKVRGGEENTGAGKACVESFSNDLQLGPGALFRWWDNCVIIHATISD
jgi:hypothetical protein